MEGIINSKSRSFLVYCFSFLIGIAAASLLDIRTGAMYGLIAIFIFLIFAILFSERRKILFASLCLLSLSLGITRYVYAWPEIPSPPVAKQYVTGIIIDEPDVRIDRVNYIIRTEAYGNIFAKSDLYPRFSYGDKVKVTCKIEIPEPIEDFRYDMYLARMGVFYVCQQPFIEVVEEGAGSPFFIAVFSFKNKLAEQIQLLWHEPYASFMAGLLYGYRGGLGKLNELFSRTGVTHIVAISGYNITMVSTILSTLLVRAYVPRKKAFYAIIAGIIVFVIFTGASASVVRAGIMGCVVLLAKHLGRMSRIANVLVFTAVIMNVENPFVLMYDAGFQLSFLSTCGLVYVSPLIQIYTKKWPEWGGIKETVEATLAATLATLPLILFQFGRLSLVSLPVNVLILWLIPWIMLAGFVAVVVGSVFFPLGSWIAALAWAGMRYIVWVVSWFSGLSFAAVDVRVAWWGMVGMYVGLVWLIYKSQK